MNLYWTRVKARVLGSIIVLLNCAFAGCVATDLKALGPTYERPHVAQDRVSIVVFAGDLSISSFRDIQVLVNGQLAGSIESHGVVVSDVEAGEVTVAVRAGDGHSGELRTLASYSGAPRMDENERLQSTWVGNADGGGEIVLELTYSGFINANPFSFVRRDALPDGPLRMTSVMTFQEPVESVDAAYLTLKIGRHQAHVNRVVYVDDTILGPLWGESAAKTLRVEPGSHVVTCRWLGYHHHPTQLNYGVGYRYGLRQRSQQVTVEPGQHVEVTMEFSLLGDAGGSVIDFRVASVVPKR